jgi:uncharacterized protein
VDTEQMKLHSPSQLITFIDSPYASWHDRALKEYPESFKDLQDEEDKLQSVLQKKGFEHEKKILEGFRARGLRIKENVQFGEVATAIMEGYDVIYQAKLTTERFCGDADFIVKEDGEYVIYDTKLAREVKPYMIYQLCIYTEALGLILGEIPKKFKIITGLGEIITKNTFDYFYYFKAVEKEFLHFHDSFEINNPPLPENYASHGSWSDHAEIELLKRDHLSIVASITRKNIQNLEGIGIATVQDLIESPFSTDTRIDKDIFERLKMQAKLQRDSETKEKPLYKIRREINIPTKTPEDLYFDMEGYPLYGKDGLEYLFGMTLPNGNFVDFWAHNEEEEKKAFSDFVDLAISNFKKNKSMKIYHYASYEVIAMRKLSTKYGLKEKEVDTLLRNEVFIDLYKVVKDSLIIGTPNYSIKSVEKIYRPKRKTEVANAGDSVVAYAEWIESAESKDWQESKRLKNIRDYNKDDCDSTLELADWLRSLMTKKYKSPEKEIKEKTEKETDIDLIRKDFLVKYPNDPIFENLTYLLDFNQRKDKPMWWRYFDRYTMSKVEFEEDLSCLSELHFKEKNNNEVIYTFEPSEETKIKGGDTCVSLENITFNIIGVDTKKGILKGKVAYKNLDNLPRKVSLMIHQSFNTKSIDERILEFVAHYNDRDKKFLAVRDFLNRSRPRLTKTKFPLVEINESRTNEALKIVDILDETTLCIQGPPGTGKTYTASKMIAHVVRKGKKVAILSNSHKAIINLLNAAFLELLPNEKISGLKIGQKNQEDITDSRIDIVDAVDDLNGYHVFAGTIFSICKCPLEYFDYLFIDEAGQVALAHLVAGGMSAKNIILMGDQQQLPQPVEGSHPLETGLSLLDYYLQGKPTIDDDFGIFLNVTYRMHSDISDFISKSIYEGKIYSHKENDKRIVQKAKELELESGIVFVPVDHVGNSQASVEERRAIIELTRSILGRNKTDKAGVIIGKISLEDILFVAPYNLQVSLLSEDLERQFKLVPKVGSVDKFQGQEAYIVILSMCTSSELEIGSRGIDFLFSLNRLNVAITRAQSLAFVVGSPNLNNVRTSSIDKMINLNFWNYLVNSSKK